MKNFLLSLVFILATLCPGTSFAINKVGYDRPDSVYLFSYGTNGLRFAWSLDKQNWTRIGNGYIFLKSDYGTWGAEKKMYTPYLFKGKDNLWQLVWSLNDYTLQFAHSSSKDLVSWGPQSYPYINKGKNILKPVISYNHASQIHEVSWVDGNGKYYQTTSKDLKNYSKAEEVTASAYKNKSVTIVIAGESNEGQIHRVSWNIVDGLIKSYELQQFKAAQNSEVAKDDPQRFAGLKPLDAKIVLHPQETKRISDLLTGVFFEDINYAADGGLYAELVQNRGFEYHPYDKKYRDKDWDASYAWSIKGEKATLTIDSLSPIHPNNKHFAVLKVERPGASLTNSGYDGIAVKKGLSYNFSAFIKQVEGTGNKVEVRLVSDKQGVLAKTVLRYPASGWKTLNSTLKPSSDAVDVRLELQPLSSGALAFDMVSLFPTNTFKGRKNGLRADLAQAVADIRPRFIRFPGGCVAHGDGLANIYRWKNTIGPLETRKGDRNIWNYHQSMGLGFFEYFQFCEDIGAEPVPIVAAGVPCQNSSHGGGGQQGGIPMSEMDEYIQDVIDLVEWANGGVNTPWGKKRADAGHPKPFNLKYLGIGNEDQITEVFKERFEMIYKAVRKAHPEITIIGTAGPFFEGTDYEEGWKIASDLKVPVIDEHYYQSPGWFINNQDFYDKYDRSKSKVYLGEYAASLPGGNRTNLETSLAEAVYLTSLERNGDVVHMASYAPLLAKEGHTQWNPDMIYFNNTEVKPTVGYYIQQLYGQNAGDQYIPASLNLSNPSENVRKRIAYSVVRDSKTNDLIVKMVNVLPTSVNAGINFNGITTGGRVLKTVITGNPDDRSVQPLKSELSSSAFNNNLELPPYSFTVLRFKRKQN
ncbi:alpha-L-arabinofuranosidase C-terminal domain-containing protein [Desertivirga arenae]|uniref:alpha-L-arabinofuranosidase C-terminal domain-containing protein n=1 Tax=Desertivirga arenae TaxID=2810309 RepID=UPI001A9604AA|nr:alpha-L-arabinofuranosidase C-terminal domain-containing protein [Pedobacter sp. SYSU D00823]